MILRTLLVGRPFGSGEMGFSVAHYGVDASRVRDQLRCTHPIARDKASPGGYFLGASMFEFSQEDLNDQWGVRTFLEPTRFTTAPVQARGSGASYIPGGTYRIDELKERPSWDAIETGFHAKQQDCSGG